MESHTHTYTYSPSPMTLVSVRSLKGILSDFGRLASSMPMEEGGGGVPDPTIFITAGRERERRERGRGGSGREGGGEREGEREGERKGGREGEEGGRREGERREKGEMKGWNSSTPPLSTYYCLRPSGISVSTCF